MPKPPIDPDSFDKINFIIDSWSTGCRAPWYIYIETMGPAALEAFIVMLSFGWADVIRGALRPKGLGRRTTKRKGKWSKRIPAFPEPGNTLGKWLPFAEQIEDFTNWGTKTKGLWRIDNAIQAGLFWWLVADVAEDFVFNWTSLLYETHWCKEPELGKFSYRNAGMTSKFGNAWRLAAYGIEDYEIPMPAWGFQSGRTGATGATIAATKSFAAWPPLAPPNNCKIAIWDATNNKWLAETASNTPDADGVFRLPVVHRTREDITFRVYFWHDASYCLVGNGCVVGVARA